MPARLRTLTTSEPEILTVASVKKWLRRNEITLKSDADAVELLPVFLSQSNKIWGFLQAIDFQRAFDSYVDQIAVLRAVKDVCADIISRFDPHVYLYVGVGRSAAPFIACLKNQNCRTVSIPLSAFRPAANSTSITDPWLLTGMPARPRITAAQQIDVFKHFDHRFGATLGRGKVLMIDYTEGGQAILAGQEILQSYMAARKHVCCGDNPIEVHALAICRNSDSRTIEAIGSEIARPRGWANPVDRWFWTDVRTDFGHRWHVYPLGAFAQPLSRRHQVLSDALHKEAFEGVAAYGSYKILENPSQGFTDYEAMHGNNSGFAALQAALRGV